jgi:hypothetical protein
MNLFSEKNNKFIIYTRTPWKEPPRARHQFSKALAKNNEVYFVEANSFSLIPKFKIVQEENLFLIKTKWFFDFRIRYRIPFLNLLYQKWLIRKLKKSNLVLDTIFVTFDHTSNSIVKKYSNCVYYVNDDHTRKSNKSFDYFYKNHVKSETEILNNCKMIVVTSKGLSEKFISYSDKTVEIPLGAPDVDYLSEFSENKLKKIALVGYLSSKRTPKNVLKNLAENQDLELFLIGPCENNLKEDLTDIKNIHFEGVLEGDKLNHFLQTCDVGIAPYNSNDINLGATPNKLWLYLSNGLPVVVTQMDNISTWIFPEKSVYEADKQNQNFVQLVEKALSENEELKRQNRFEHARQNNWENRVSVFLSELNKLLK